MRKTLLIILGILVVLIIAFLVLDYVLLNKSDEMACTEEAKLCSDGTAVGRTGPNCEFAECPTIPGCANLWWHDNNHLSCQEPKQFCGAYMYQGLQTFETKKACENDLAFKDWKIYSDSRFSYKCPQDWLLGKNQNYNGQVNLSECAKIYSGQMSFDDGVAITFGFVPQIVADGYEINNENYSEILLNETKNETNARPYSNNNFSGWISMKNQKHTLKLIGRYHVSNGYYEVIADVAGDTKTDTEFKQMIDDIISTFNAN